MSSIEESVEIDVGVEPVFRQWESFEKLPRFMESVQSVRRVERDLLRWVVEVAGERREFDARITELIEGSRIARTTEGEGPTHSGVVTFHRLDEDRSKVMVQMDIEPEGLVESAGDLLGVVRRRVARDLENFREMMERRTMA